MVTYRQDAFLLEMLRHEQSLRQWKADGTELDARTSGTPCSTPVSNTEPGLESDDKIIIVRWYRDESTYYTNDCRDIRWVHSSEKSIRKT